MKAEDHKKSNKGHVISIFIIDLLHFYCTAL